MDFGWAAYSVLGFDIVLCMVSWGVWFRVGLI